MQFDPHGRLVPLDDQAGVFPTSRRYFRITSPDVDVTTAKARLERHFNTTFADFESRCDAILQRLRQDVETAGVLDGPKVPFALPQAKHPDVGQALEQVYLPAAKASFQEAVPTGNFDNHVGESLEGKLGEQVLGRHDQLITAMAEGPVVGWFFPCLTEYTPEAAAARVAALPSPFLLAGAYDTAAAFVANPGLLLRDDGYPPLIWLAGVSGDTPTAGYHFEAYGHNMTFNRRVHFNEPAESWASGIVVLG